MVRRLPDFTRTQRMNFRQIVAPVLIIALTLALAFELPQAIAARDRDYDWYTPVIDVRTLLNERFVREIDLDAMQRAAIAAMVDSLGDPHTIYVPPRDTMVFEKEMSGQYTGIGAEIRGANDRLMIITPLDGSPALEAGLRHGDMLLTIDGTDTKGIGPEACIDLLLGEPGTKVELRIRRPNGTETDIAVTRAPIAAPTVEGLLRRDGQWQHWFDEASGLAYVEVDQFTGTTVPELRRFLSEHGDALQGLVIDLRGNPGGALPAAVQSADLFMADGPIVHIKPQRDDRADEAHTYSARKGHAAEDIPVVVLVDQHAASASEILAGALASGDARVVGERTFGKGSVQELRTLDDDHGLVKFTTALYALPDGRILQRHPEDPKADWGVDPSPGCVVPEDEVQRFARRQAREPWRVISASEPQAPKATDATWMRDTLLDPALAEAAALLHERVSGGQWPTLEADTDLAFDPPSQDLTLARDARLVLLEQLNRVDREILRLTDGGIEAAMGFGALPDDAKIGGLEVVLRNADGVIIGTWKAANPRAAHAALHAAQLKKVDDTP